MMQAHREGRIDDMLGFVHPEVHWRPMFRPGLELCVGRAAVRKLVEDISAAIGQYWFELDEIVERPDGGVRACARVVLAGGQGGTTDDGVEFTVTFLDGLMHEVATFPSSPAASTRWGAADSSGLSTITVPLGKVTIVVLDGVLSKDNRAAVVGAVHGAIATRRELVQLECYGVGSVGPGAVEVLREAIEIGAAAGIRMQVLRPSPAVRELTASLAQIVDVVD